MRDIEDDPDAETIQTYMARMTKAGVVRWDSNSFLNRGIYTCKEPIIFPQPHFQKEVILPEV